MKVTKLEKLLADAWDPALDPITSNSLPCPWVTALCSPGKEPAGTVLIHRWETEEAEGKGTQGHCLIKDKDVGHEIYFCLAPTGSTTRASKQYMLLHEQSWYFQQT